MSEQPRAIPPHVRLTQMGTGYWISRLVWTAANLRIPDHLANGSKSAAEIAALTGTQSTRASSIHADTGWFRPRRKLNRPVSDRAGWKDHANRKGSVEGSQGISPAVRRLRLADHRRCWWRTRAPVVCWCCSAGVQGRVAVPGRLRCGNGPLRYLKSFQSSPANPFESQTT